MDGVAPGEFEPDDARESGARISRRAAARLFHLPPGVPFLPELVAALCDGRLVPGFSCDPADPASDPSALADATIYVPTRRAARELRGAFVSALVAGGTARSAILPTIRALGDVEDEPGFFDEATPETLALAPVMEDTDRTIELAKLVLSWIRKLPDHLRDLHEGAALEVPSSPADAVWLARDLMGLMDEMESQGTALAEIHEIDAGDQALWWQLTTRFLSIITEVWPGVLEAADRSNPASHRNAAIRAEARRLREGRARGPVIVAVSPNLGPATIDLVDAVARLPAGAVVLPGLDASNEGTAPTLDDAEFAMLGVSEALDERAPGHPQFGHSRLLAALGVLRGDVEPLAREEPSLARRTRAIAEALRPARTTHRWVETAGTLELGEAFDRVSLVEAPGPREEALAIAASLRDAIEEPGATAALVTADRALARRVRVELARFGIEADDSAGTPLMASSPAAMMRLALAAALDPGDPHALLGLLKHPLARLGLTRSFVRRATLVIELVVLRSGPPVRMNVVELSDMFEGRLARLREEKRQPFWMPRFDDEAIEEARELIARVSEALFLLSDARQADAAHPPSVWVGMIGYTLDRLGRDEDEGLDRLYGTDAGAVLRRALASLMAADDMAGLDITPAELPAAMEALLSGEAVRAPASGHPRVAILGLIESRLMDYGTVVLGGLNEGSWPSQTTTDQFLSRPMRQTLKLEVPERRIGLEAHDFTMMAGTPELVLTRSRKSDGAPMTPSRWLERLRAVLPAETWEDMRGRGEAMLDEIAELEGRERTKPPASRPAPTPPVAVRPTTLSVTEIETLRRDPYAVYAKRILGLVPLETPKALPDARERGTLFHAIVERFVRDGIDPTRPDARARLDKIAAHEFDALALPDDIRALWWPRYDEMAEHYLRWERDRRPRVAASHLEASGRLDIEGVRLSGRADRIDVMDDGRVEIIDYKTGSTPVVKDAWTLLSPQLPLEAAMAARGAFKVLGEARASSLLYVRLRPGTKSDGKAKFAAESLESAKDERSADDLGERAWQQLGALLRHYRDPATPYRSREIPFREAEMGGDYDHLARAREWGIGGDDGEGGGDGGEGDA